MTAPGFLFAEDEAIKAKVSGLKLTDNTAGGNPVTVFYGYPAAGRETRYPYLTIDLLSVDHAIDLQSSDQPINVTYAPDVTPDAKTLQATLPPSNFSLTSYEYVPVWLTYQLMTHTRFAQHDRQLHSQLLYTLGGFRWGYLNIPEDGTTRRLDLLSWTQADRLDRGDKETKRTWRKAYTVRTNAELSVFAIQQVQQVATVSITLQAWAGIVPPGGQDPQHQYEGPYT